MKTKMKLLSLVLVCTFFAIVGTSCSEKRQALRDLEKLADDVEENGRDYSVMDWIEIFDQYQIISETIDKHKMDYSQNQKARIRKARSAIKSAAWDAMTVKMDNLPQYIKEPLINVYHKLFGSEPSDEQ